MAGLTAWCPRRGGPARRPGGDRAAELLLLAVPDDALADLVAGLANAGVLRRGTIVAHTSGAHGVDVLEPLVGRGRRYRSRCTRS